METEQVAAGSELTPSEELQSRFPSFELDFGHEQLEHLEECTRGVVFYGGGNPHPPARRDEDGQPGPAKGVEQPDGPLYQRQYNSASVLVCSIPGIEDALYDTSPEDQLSWLHSLHVKVDALLKDIPALKVEVSGGCMLFVSGVENEDLYHADTLVRLAEALLRLAGTLLLPDGQPMLLKMGIHSGELVSGVIGSLALRYSVYGPVVCTALLLADCAEPGSLRVSAATHSRLAGEWPWDRAPPRPVRLSDGWSLRVTNVDADAVAVAKERSRYDGSIAANSVCFADRRLEALWKQAAYARFRLTDAVVLFALLVALAAAAIAVHGQAGTVLRMLMSWAATATAAVAMAAALGANVTRPQTYISDRERILSGVRLSLSLLLALSPTRAVLQQAATAAAARVAAVSGVYTASVQLQRCSRVIVVPLTTMFGLALLLPLRLRVQLPLTLACLVPVLAGMGMDSMLPTEGAGLRASSVECLRSTALILLGSVVAPALCQFASERASRRAFAKIYSGTQSGNKWQKV